MATPVSQFDYVLPPERIAQCSVEPRDRSRLMALDRIHTPRLPTEGQQAAPLGRGANVAPWRHKRFFEIADELQAGDVLVVNKTKVFKARLRGRVTPSFEEGAGGSSGGGKDVEIFLLRPRVEAAGSSWEALARPGRRVRVGDVIALAEGWSCVVVAKEKDGRVRLSFAQTADEVIAFANAHGEIPVPPYVKTAPDAFDRYQTVYAERVGSVAAPTAGFHFTAELIERLKGKGVQFETIVLHVGIGTFRPMKTETIEEHEMHAEYVEIEGDTARRINQAKAEGRRVIAVGTTTVRALEGAAAATPPPAEEGPAGSLPLERGGRVYSRPLLSKEGLGVVAGCPLPADGFVGDVNLFITPGFRFRIVDALITNFHLPKSTLLVLVSAFAGREHVLAAYEEAVKQGYRFYSFGDAMFIR